MAGRARAAVAARNVGIHLAAAGTLFLAGCFRSPSTSTRFSASSAAKIVGVDAYHIVHVDRKNLDVRLEGRAGGRLKIEVHGDVVTQHLRSDNQSVFVLRTSPERIETSRPQGARLLAAKTQNGWVSPENPSHVEIARIRVLLAVDVDLAVQGASMIWDGSAYVFCTWECVRATECIERRPFAECPSRIVACAACLEQEP